eukprot:1572769-Pleurochrysis_carterae.AAC.1
MGPAARRKALVRHINDISTALMSAGSIDWLPSSLALALKSMGILDELLATKVFAEIKLQLVEDLGNVLKAEWG